MLATPASAPAAWLASGPNGIGDKAVVAQILESFDGTPTVSRIAGPETLLRAVGRDERGRLANSYRGYWVRESALMAVHGSLGQFEGWLTDQELSAAAEWRYRAFTAVCLNWNDFGEFAELRLPGGEGIPCLIGRAAAQPLHSSMVPAASATPILRGGIEQIFFRGGDANPLWVYLRSKADLF